jgi:hypothetical protein
VFQCLWTLHGKRLELKVHQSDRNVVATSVPSQVGAPHVSTAASNSNSERAGGQHVRCSFRSAEAQLASGAERPSLIGGCLQF